MSLRLEIDVSEQLEEHVRFLNDAFGDLSRINKKVAAAEENFFRDYLRAVARNRHATARGLGATPTGFFERAAESPEGTATATGAVISVSPSEAFARAFRDVEITPKNGKKWITIPAHRAAYGRRAGSFRNLQFVPMRNDLAALVARSKSDGKMTVYYWLKKRVVQKQQRELLPSEAAIAEVALEVVEDEVKAILT